MLHVASKLSFLELCYFCASAELDWPMYKTMQQERRSYFCKEAWQEQGSEEYREEQANEWTDACACTHIQDLYCQYYRSAFNVGRFIT